MDWELCKGFHKLFDSEIEILDLLNKGKMECNISALAHILNKDISNVKKTVLAMETNGLIICTRVKGIRYNPIIAIEISDNIEYVIRNIKRR